MGSAGGVAGPRPRKPWSLWRPRTGPRHWPHPDAARSRWRGRDAAGLVTEAIEPGSAVHTDGWDGYARLDANGYRHRVTYLRGEHALASELLPRVHRVVSLLKRWLLGTHHGRVGHAHLDYYLDEFTFRFNRRRSRHRGKLFFRLVQQAVAIVAHTVSTARSGRPQSSSVAKPQDVGVT